MPRTRNPKWDHVVIDEQYSIVYTGTADECVEWAALTGAERQTTYRVREYQPTPKEQT